MMDSPEYVENAIFKIEQYQKYGYFPGINLILTHETSRVPLNTKVIEQIIELYLL